MLTMFSTRTAWETVRSQPLRWLAVGMLCLSVQIAGTSAARAATATCSLPNDPTFGPNIGFQYVAQACAQSDGRFIYNYYDLNCNQSRYVEGINESLGKTPRTPEEMQTALINYLNAVYPDGSPNAYYKTSLKMFRNATGSSFVFVIGSYSKYNQSIDGLNMGSGSYAYWPTFNRVDFNIFSYPNGQTPPCCLTVAPTASPSPFKPSMGETTAFSGNITSNYPVNWTFSIKDTSASGTGSGSYSWDGKDADGFPLPAGGYSGTFSATSASCSATGGATVDIVDPPKECPLNANFGSTANVATGNLSFTQEIFSTKSSTFPLSFSLGYNSHDTTTGPLGPSWHHSYEISLQGSDGNAKVLVEGGKRHVYSWDGSAYVAETGDTSVLDSNGHDLTFVDGRTYTFNPDGTLSTITDKDNNVLTFSYTDGDLTTISDGWRTITLGYDPDAAHQLKTVDDPNRNRFTFEYNGPRLWKVTNPVTDPGVAAGYWEYTYNTDNLLRDKRDPAGNHIQYGYDGKRINSATDPNQKSRGLVYPTTTDNVRTTTFTEKDGGQWLYTYDIQTGFLKEKGPAGGKKTTYYYNADTTLRARTEPFDNNYLTTFYTYDSNGNMLTRTDPVDISVYTPAIDPQTVDIASLAGLTPPIKTALSYTYDYAHFDQLASVTDERFTPVRTTTYQYTTDANDLNVTTVTDPESKQTITRYNPNGTIAEVEDGNGKKTVYAYYPDTQANRDAGLAGQLASITGPDNVSTRYTFYDYNGNPQEIVVRDAAGRETTTDREYDALNRLRVVTRFAADLPDNITRYDYDDLNNRYTITDPEKHQTTYVRNFQDRVTSITDARQKVTGFEYGTGGCPSCSGVDKLTAVQDARQKRTTYQYDTLGQLERETDPLGKVIRYTYYDNGLVKEKIDTTNPAAEVILITHYYDNNGRLTRKLYADGTDATFTYYPDGSLWTATNPNISYSYTYYNNGWLKSVTDSNGRVINYDEYDNIDQRKTVTYFPGTADERVIRYHYDDANRLDTVTGAAGIFSLGYDDSSRRRTLSYPNHITATYGYDDLNRLTSLIHRAEDGSVIADNGYTHYQAGNRETRTGTVNETYHYDEVYRLTDIDTARGTEHYTYDDVGNRLSGPGTRDDTSTYSYNDANQIVTGRTLSFLYDNRGNQTQRVIHNAADKNWTLGWGDENRLMQVQKASGATESRTTTFKYDALGRRIEKRYTTTKDRATTTITTTYIHDGDNVILEIVDDGTTTPSKTFYTHGLDTDEPLALERDGQFYYYHQDGLGSVTAITGSTGSNYNIVQRYSYNAFGMPKASTGFRNPYQFTGREWDPETGFYFYQARYYDPLEGRFIQKDPIGFDGGDVNLYVYVQNNPINLIDPTGNNALAGAELGAELGSCLGPVGAFTGAALGAGIGYLAMDYLGNLSYKSPGNQVDTQIQKEYEKDYSAARMRGCPPPDKCEWLAQNASKFKAEQVKATAKAWGCKRSRYCKGGKPR